MSLYLRRALSLKPEERFGNNRKVLDPDFVEHIDSDKGSHLSEVRIAWLL